MPRHARLQAPGALVHVIGRFVNRAVRLAGPLERAAVLERIPLALARSDWTLHYYAPMSSHIYLALLAGQQPPWQLVKPLHFSIAQVLNRMQGALGPVFAERATTVLLAPGRLGSLAAYLHNNPVRAGVVGHAVESDWTGHRAWVGLVPAGRRPRTAPCRLRPEPRRTPRLRRPHGCGAGRAAGQSVQRLAQAAERRQARALTGLPVEVSSPVLLPDAMRQAFHPGPLLAGPRWSGALGELVNEVARRLEWRQRQSPRGAAAPRWYGRGDWC